MTDKERICGILHDVLEDSECTVDEICDNGFPEQIIDTLMLLRHDKTVDYMDYVKAIVDSGNKTALVVKNNVLNPNLAHGKAGGQTKQVKKHTAALDYIMSKAE